MVLGGASLDEPLKEGVGMKSNGSVLIIESDTEAEARKIVESDVYYTAGVWDVEKVCQIESVVRLAIHVWELTWCYRSRCILFQAPFGRGNRLATYAQDIWHLHGVSMERSGITSLASEAPRLWSSQLC